MAKAHLMEWWDTLLSSRFFSPVSRYMWARKVKKSGYFDLEWYKLAHPYLVRDGVNPLMHFLEHGKQYRLSPSRSFDTERYINEHEDALLSCLNPLVHFLKRGRARNFLIHSGEPSGADRIAASGLFDGEWYLGRYTDVAEFEYPPLLHYMVYGALEGRSPGPDFDSKLYLARYPDVAGLNPLLHYLDHGRNEGRIPSESGDTTDLELRSQSRVLRTLNRILAVIETPPRAIVFLSLLVNDGTELAAYHAVRALSEEYGEKSIVIFLGDSDGQEASPLLPDGVLLVSFSRIESDLTLGERADLVELLVRSLQPEVSLNVNCQACWRAVKLHGRRLARATRIYSMPFWEDYLPNGRSGDHSGQFLSDCLPHLTGVYLGSQIFIDALIGEYQIPKELQPRFAELPQPTLHLPKQRARNRIANEPLRVLWAGRLASQGNVLLLFELAEANTQFEFHIWGKGSHALEMRARALAERYPHVHFHGPFDRFDTLPFADYDAFLYTSLRGGVPNALLEAAAFGLPVVASNVGGIAGLVTGETGWLVDEIKNPAAYKAALDSIDASPQDVEIRTAAMMDTLRKRHNWSIYRDILLHKPLSTRGLLHPACRDEVHSMRPPD